MLIYIITIIVSVFFSFIAQCLKKNIDKSRRIKLVYWIFCILAFLPPFLVAAFRGYSVGTDTDSTYLSIYNLVLNGYGGVRDKGYALINELSILIFDNYTGVLILTSLLMYACFYKCIFNQSKYPSMSTYLFFATNVYFISMNMIRQSIAISLFTLSIICIKDRKLFKFLLLNILGFFMHSSAIVYLPIYFLLNHKLKVRNVLILVIVFGLFGGVLSNYIIKFLYQFSYFTDHFAWYFDSMYNTGTLSLFSLLVSLCILVFLLLINKNAREDNDYNILLWLQFISFICLILTSFIPLMQRISWLFSFSLFIYLPRMFDYINNKKLKLLFKIGILGGYTCYMVMTIFIMGYNEVVPYVSVWG